MVPSSSGRLATLQLTSVSANGIVGLGEIMRTGDVVPGDVVYKGSSVMDVPVDDARVVRLSTGSVAKAGLLHVFGKPWT